MAEDSPELSDAWLLWRVDDNGGQFLVSRHETRADAEEASQRFEARGHKQHYWVAKAGANSSSGDGSQK